MVTEHHVALFKLACRLVGDRIEAEDVVQETFQSVWKGRRNYQPGRGDRAWLATILRRRAADAFRKRPLKLVLSGDRNLEVETRGHDPLFDEYSDEVQRSLNQLPDELRETLLLVVVGELTHPEAADALGVPIGTVLSRVSRARNRLREYLSPPSARNMEDEG
ncbi:MAG: RNA polymerase sigma factor [Planctomycetales bacterium]